MSPSSTRGIDTNHPDLHGRLVPSYSFRKDNLDTADGEGITGIAHGAMLMPVKVMAGGCYGTDSRMSAGILYAVDSGTRIVAITSCAHADSLLLHDAIFGHGLANALRAAEAAVPTVMGE